ncbi:P-loop containing nucleoside triphosphate hydrolase protein [Suillus subluteus]|nr:P-loop containing nucleoside triphosphate hydrolase protein [Suillus subluteus]
MVSTGDLVINEPQQRYNTRFKLNRIPMRRQHQALDTAFASDKFLFPQKAHISPLASRPDVGPIVPFNPLIATNPPQLQAVTSILLRQQGSAIINQTHILATAPSNSAADIIASRLASTLGPDELFRLNAPSRHFDQVPDELQRYTHKETGRGRQELLLFIVCTCVSASIPYGIGIPHGHFTHIFVDEAGQATEPEVMIGIKTMADNATNIVLAGDPKQELGLGRSYLERLMSNGCTRSSNIVKLAKNFRSHPAILKFPNERFYANDLESCGNKNIVRAFEGWKKLPSKKFPVIFHSISGKDDCEASSPSVAHNEIGVTAPHHAQCVKIHKMLSDVADEVKVGSVEEFQGQVGKFRSLSSREFIEFDLKYTLSFVANLRRFNAQALLIVVGDPNVLSLDPLWRSFLNYVHLNGGWAGPGPIWDTTETVDESGEYDQHIRAAAMTNMNLTRRIEVVAENVQTGTDNEDDANFDKPWRELE